MEKLSDQSRLRPWMGILLLAVEIVLFIFLFTPLQVNFGIPGLVITELAFIVLAVTFCLIRKVKIKEVFPVKKFKIRELIGALLLILGSFPLSLLFVAFSATVFPSSAAEAQGISDMLYGTMSYPVTVLVVALMPAICEEMLHRGAILSSMRNIKNENLIILIMGLFFGIFHLSVLRFLSTAFLGLMLSYVVVKKNNILLSMIMHFANNLISLTIGFISAQSNTVQAAAATQIDYSSLLGTYMLLAFASPMIIALGMFLIEGNSFRKIKLLFAGIACVLFLVGGIGLTVANASKNMLLNSQLSYRITADAKEDNSLTFDVPEDREATVVVVVTNAKGDYNVRIDGDKGSNIINAPVSQGSIRMINYHVGLPADHYTVTITAGDNAVGEQPVIQVTIS